MTRIAATLPRPEFAQRSKLAGLGYALAVMLVGSLLLTLSAKVQVPFWPVPMTFQPMALVIVGFAFGPRLGVATVLFYLAQGAFGLPVFAGTPEKGLGLLYMAGPTGGYLAGFALVTLVAGWIGNRTGALVPLFFGALLAMSMSYIPGVAWLSTFIGFEQAIAVGALPFLLGDVMKALLAAVLMVGLARAVRGGDARA